MSTVRRRLVTSGIGVLSVFVAAACASGSTGGTAADAQFEGTDGAVLYAQACASCHGADLAGTDQGPPFLDSIYRPGHHSDPAFFLAIRRGVRSHHWSFGNMPPIEGLSEEQIDAIVAFVRGGQREAGIE